MSSWFIYSFRYVDESFYTGVAKDIVRRCKQHYDGKVSRSTRSRRPVRLVYQETHPDQGPARKREAAIKALSRR